MEKFIKGGEKNMSKERFTRREILRKAIIVGGCIANGGLLADLNMQEKYLSNEVQKSFPTVENSCSPTALSGGIECVYIMETDIEKAPQPSQISLLRAAEKYRRVIINERIGSLRFALEQTGVVLSLIFWPALCVEVINSLDQSKEGPK